MTPVNNEGVLVSTEDSGEHKGRSIHQDSNRTKGRGIENLVNAGLVIPSQLRLAANSTLRALSAKDHFRRRIVMHLQSLSLEEAQNGHWPDQAPQRRPIGPATNSWRPLKERRYRQPRFVPSTPTSTSAWCRRPWPWPEVHPRWPDPWRCGRRGPSQRTALSSPT